MRLSQALASTALNRATYDTDTQELTVEFAGGDEYTFSGVPQSVYDGLITARSAGRFYHAVIKGAY
jgi:hypothetical protein